MRAAYLLSPSFITRGRMGASKAALILMKNSHFDRTLQYSSRKNKFCCSWIRLSHQSSAVASKMVLILHLYTTEKPIQKFGFRRGFTTKCNKRKYLWNNLMVKPFSPWKKFGETRTFFNLIIAINIQGFQDKWAIGYGGRSFSTQVW